MMEEEILVSVQLDRDEEEKKVKSLTDAITKLKDVNKTLTSENKNLSKSAGNNTKAISRNNAQIELNKGVVTKLNAERRNSIKAIQAEENSLDSIKTRLAANTAARGKLNLSNVEAQKKFVALTKAIHDDTKALNTAEQAGGNYTRQVGNYSQALANVPGPAGQAINAIKGMTAAARAFIATPLGAIIAVIVGALASLSAFFKSSEEGQDALNKVTRVFNVILGNLSDIVANVGEALFNAFTSPKETLLDLVEIVKQNLINRFTAFGVILDGIINLDFKKVADGAIQAATGVTNATDKIANGWNSATKAVTEFIEETAKEITQAQLLADLEATTNRQERQALIDRAKLERDTAELRLKAKDRENFTDQERLDFLREANRLQDEQLDRDLEIARNRLRIQQVENSFSKSTRENLEAEAKLQAEVFNVEFRNFSTRRKLKSEEQSLVTSIAKQNEKEEKERLKALERTFKAEEALILFNLESNVKQAKNVQERFEAEKALELQRRDFLLNNESLIEAEKQLIIEKSNQVINNLEANLNDDLEKERLKDFEKRQEERELEKERLTEFAIFRGESEAKLRDLIKEFNDQTLEDLKETFGEQSKEYVTFFNSVNEEVDLSFKAMVNHAQSTVNTISSLMRQQAQAEALERQNELDDIQLKENAKLEAIQKRLDSGTISEEQAEKLRTKIQSEADAERLMIERRAFEDNKKRQITQSKIDTFNAAIAAYRALAPIPLVGPGLGAVAAAAAISFGERQTKAIRSQKFIGSFKEGGYIDIDGKPHSQGGTNFISDTGITFEAQKDEGLFILKKEANQSFKRQLSGLNVAHGGRSFDQSGSSFLQDGGQVATSIATASLNQNIENDFNLRLDLVEAIREIPPPQVDVRKITTAANQVEVTQSRASQ